MIHLPGVLATAGEVQRFCHTQGWRFCFIGGVALQRWGEPRLRQAVDLMLLTGFGKEQEFVDRSVARVGVGIKDKIGHPRCAAGVERLLETGGVEPGANRVGADDCDRLAFVVARQGNAPCSTD